MRNQKLWCQFSQKFRSQFGWNSIIMLSEPIGLLKLMLNLFYMSNIQGRELCWHDFMKYMINIVLCWDTCELCFKLGMMLDMSKLYGLIPVWMSVMLTQDHRVTGKLEILQSFCCKVAWSNLIVFDGWFCKGDDSEVQYGKHGSQYGTHRSSEHLLLFCWMESCKYSLLPWILIKWDQMSMRFI